MGEITTCRVSINSMKSLTPFYFIYCKHSIYETFMCIWMKSKLPEHSFLFSRLTKTIHETNMQIYVFS